MSMVLSSRALLACALGAFTLVACSDEHSHDHGVDAAPPVIDAAPDAPPAAASVTLALTHLVAGAPVAIGTTTPYTNTAGNAFGVTVVRYFISDVTLTYADQQERRIAGVHYVDHDLPATLAWHLADDLPTGPLASVAFTMGLAPANNVTGAFTAPPESLMEWPVMMGGGYHYLKFESRYVDRSAAPFNFKVHAGPLQGTDYSFPVVLDATGHTVGAAGATLPVQMNLERWFGAWDLNDYFNAAHPGIMGDAAAQAALRANGAAVFTLGPS